MNFNLTVFLTFYETEVTKYLFLTKIRYLVHLKPKKKFLIKG
jgi:hypothetical protein